MVKNKKELIKSLIKNEISQLEFIRNYNEFHGEINICRLLKEAKKSSDAEALDLYIYLGSVLAYSFNCIDILNKLLLDTWHQKHEEIVRILSFHNDKTSEEYLYKATSLHLDYLEYDEDYVLADKCIRALAKLKSKSAKDKLIILGESKNKAISESAKKQLDRIS